MTSTATIKHGASIYQDMRIMRWPLRGVDDPDMVFEIRGEASKGWVWLVAHGFGKVGKSGSYGNGAIAVEEHQVNHLHPKLNARY